MGKFSTKQIELIVVGNTRMFFVYVFSIVLMTSCMEKRPRMNSRVFIEKNLDRSFESWKDWSCYYRMGGYILRYDTIRTYEDREHIIIFAHRKNDSIFIRFETVKTSRESDMYPKGGTMPLDELSQDSAWINIFSKYINENDFRANLRFLADNYVDVKTIRGSSNLIFFEGDDIEVLYMFHPIDSGFSRYSKKIAPNWFIQDVKENK